MRCHNYPLLSGGFFRIVSHPSIIDISMKAELDRIDVIASFI
jgi:hypothetical protein